MNERILELARQVWPDPNISHVNHMKFAELIIQECLLSLEPNLYESDIEYKVDQAIYKRCERIILKHFGIDNERTS